VVPVIVIRVLGDSDAGKTTLIERLVPLLSERGRVGTVKSIHHTHELDEEGKDTHRHRTAGAECVVGITPSLTATFEARGKDDFASEPAALAHVLQDFRDDGYEYVLVEGFSDASIPSLVVGEPDGSEDQVLARVEAPRSADVGALVRRIAEADSWTGEP